MWSQRRTLEMKSEMMTIKCIKNISLTIHVSSYNSSDQSYVDGKVIEIEKWSLKQHETHFGCPSDADFRRLYHKHIRRTPGSVKVNLDDGVQWDAMMKGVKYEMPTHYTSDVFIQIIK